VSFILRIRKACGERSRRRLDNAIAVGEHNLEVIKTADWIVDLGPEGGDKGGRVVAVGTPEHIADVAASYTGQYLRAYLARAGLGEKKKLKRA
jgi:excinuclease ABC subunit A